jgi:hypothetical protein
LVEARHDSRRNHRKSAKVSLESLDAELTKISWKNCPMLFMK